MIRKHKQQPVGSIETKFTASAIRGRVRRIRWALVFVLLLISSVAAQAANYRVGFLARNKEKPKDSEFQPTIDYLNKQIPDSTFTLVDLSFDGLSEAVNGRQVSFIIANPLNFVDMEKSDARAIATLRRTSERGSSAKFGGVIFCRADGPQAETFGDVRGKRICAVSEKSFGGMQMQMRELSEAGIQPSELQITYAQTHEAVIDAVLSNRCDFGFVRTAALEHYCDSKQVPSVFRTIPYPKERDFPYSLSTRLYPEWPFVALGHVHDSVASKIAAALLAMPGYPNEYSDSEDLSWVAPLSYNSARLFVSKTVPKPASHYKSEAKLFGIVAAVFLCLLIFAAECGRRRRSVSLNVRNFFPCATAYLSTKATVLVTLLMIGSAERAIEAVIRWQVEAPSAVDVSIGIVAFVLMAIVMHAIFGKPTHRAESLSKLEELLENVAQRKAPWTAVEEYCPKNNVTREEFESIQARLLAARKPAGKAELIDLSKHREKWVPGDHSAPPIKDSPPASTTTSNPS
jgi:ABC-type phosphate/phosphonate transport system substrate-binding protein